MAEVTLGQSPPGASYNDTGDGTPFFQGKSEFTTTYAEVRKFTTAGTKFAVVDDILVSVRAPVGPTNLAPVDCAIGRGLAALRARNGIDQRFLLWAMRATERDLANLGAGSTFAAVTGSQLKAHELNIPPLAEQQRIVDLLEDHLSRLDAAQESVRTAIRRSSAMVRSSLAAAVTAATDDSPISTVGSEAQLVQYGTSAKCHEVPADGDIPVLRMGNVKDCEVDWEGLKYLPRHHEEFPKLLLAPGDLLFNRTNSAILVGKSAVFDASRAASLASYLIRVRFKDNVDPHWANIVINSPQGRAYIASVASQQVGQANVNGTKLKAFPLPLPSLTRQRELVAAHQRVREAAYRLNQSAELSMRRATALRRSLLSAAFSGQLTASSADLSVADETVWA